MKILLVDDSKSARYALKMQLQKHGLEVEMAESAEDAFAKLKSSLPDVIFMDHLMPGLSGFEALEVIRQDPRTAAIPVVMCTSQEEPEFAEQARAKGAFGVLPKSAAPELLPDLLERLKAALAAAPAPTAPAPAAVEPTPAPAAAPALTEEALIQAIDRRLESQIPALVKPLLEALRRELTDALQAEMRRLIEEGRAAEQAARQAAPPQPTLADLQALSTRLTTETLPGLIQRALQSERAHVQEWVERRLGEALAGQGRALPNPEEIARQSALLARQEVQAAVELPLAEAKESILALEQRLKGSLGLIYGLIALVAVLGLGAAGAVYYLLSSAGG